MAPRGVAECPQLKIASFLLPGRQGPATWHGWCLNSLVFQEKMVRQRENTWTCFSNQGLLECSWYLVSGDAFKKNIKTSGIVGRAAAIHFQYHLKLFELQRSLKSCFHSKMCFTRSYSFGCFDVHCADVQRVFTFICWRWKVFWRQSQSNIQHNLSFFSGKHQTNYYSISICLCPFDKSFKIPPGVNTWI